MFCSVSTRKSGSGWLDRIRTAKGFPQSTSTDLENFLQNPPATSPDPETSTRCTPVPNRNQSNHQQQEHPLVNVLHELFNFGDNGSNSANFKKSARKQSNPRACTFVEHRNAVSEVVRSVDANAGVVEGLKEVEEGDDGRDWDLPGFSRTEVTVIDTSYECWKFDKLLFRKKNVWKVRDKKSVSVLKKREGNVEDGECSNKNKKRKLEAKGRDESEVYEKDLDKVKKVHKKKQQDSKLENGSSSMVLIRSIPTSKKNGTNIFKSGVGR